MRQVLPPMLVLGLLGFWLLLNQTLQPGQILLGLILAVSFTLASARLRPLHAWSEPPMVLAGKRLPRLRRVPVALVLVAHVFIDNLRSSISVARIILGLHGRHAIQSGFLDIPLELRDPHGLAVLAMIVTVVPGTVWVGLNADGSSLRLHVLDLRSPAESAEFIKRRYERPLREIFE